LLIAILFLLSFPRTASAIDSDTEARLRQLAVQNEKLQQQLSEQADVIKSLKGQMSALQQTQRDNGEAPASGPESAKQRAWLGLLGSQTRLNIGGQLAAGYFKTGHEGQFPNGEFRVDDARVFLDARAWDNVYGFVELTLMTRESGDENVHLGEAYIDLEQLLKWRGLDPLINFRIGRFYIPFGEEYQVRYPMDDPLITHSLSDLWGIDEGVEIYGSYGNVQYAFAVQNGGHSALQDFTSDKSLAGRIAYEPKKWLRVSGSAMRTGDLSVQGDALSEMWFANGFFRSLGSSDTTTRFNAELLEGDVQFLFPRGHVKLAGGGIRYDDNDRSGDNHRDIYYCYAEGMFRFTKQFYAATRYSQVFADGGFPLIGQGNWGDHFYKLTDELWRVSAGIGYTPNPNFIIKVEYAIERGETVSGLSRDHEDFFGAQAALRF
jgi:hypothetical protein